MNSSRRHFLKIAGAISLGFTGLQNLLTQHGYAASKSPNIPYGFGDLIPDLDQILDLPVGFRYQIFSRRFDRMDDGFYVPAGHDGMAAFLEQFKKVHTHIHMMGTNFRVGICDVSQHLPNGFP